MEPKTLTWLICLFTTKTRVLNPGPAGVQCEGPHVWRGNGLLFWRESGYGKRIVWVWFPVSSENWVKLWSGNPVWAGQSHCRVVLICQLQPESKRLHLGPASSLALGTPSGMTPDQKIPGKEDFVGKRKKQFMLKLNSERRNLGKLHLGEESSEAELYLSGRQNSATREIQPMAKPFHVIPYTLNFLLSIIFIMSLFWLPWLSNCQGPAPVDPGNLKGGRCWHEKNFTDWYKKYKIRLGRNSVVGELSGGRGLNSLIYAEDQ